MKPWQAVVLLIFLVLDGIIVVAGAYIVTSMTAPTTQPPAASKPTVGATSSAPTETATETASPTAEASPTETSSLPLDSTPTPTISKTAGWVEYISNELTLQLPQSYAAGDPRLGGRNALIDALKSKGANFNWADVEKMLQPSSDTVLWAIDSQTGVKPIITSMEFHYQHVDPETLLADIIHRAIGELAGSYNLLEQRQIINRSYDVEQVSLSPKDPAAADSLLAIYFLKDNDIVLVINCKTAVDEWSFRQSEFDQIVRILAILHPAG